MNPKELVYVTKYNELTDEWTTFATTNISCDVWQIGNESHKRIFGSIAELYSKLRFLSTFGVEITDEHLKELDDTEMFNN